MTEPLRIVIHRGEGENVYPVDRTQIFAGDVEVRGIHRVTMSLEAGGGAATFTFEAYAIIEEVVDDDGQDEADE